MLHINFSCHFALILKRKLQHVGHIRIAVCRVSGSRGVTTFNPGPYQLANNACDLSIASYQMTSNPQSMHGYCYQQQFHLKVVAIYLSKPIASYI